MDYTGQLNQIISLLTSINSKLEAGGIVYEGFHYILAYMIIAVGVLLVGFALIIFLYRILGVK
jgi:hypothetical protein